MKMRILYSLLFVNSIFVCFSQINTSVQVNVSDIAFEQRDEYESVSWTQSCKFTHDIGAPMLPCVYKTFVLPYNSKFKNIEYNISNRRKLDKSLYLYPVQPEYIVSSADERVFQEDSTIYNSDIPYPDVKVRVVAEYDEMGYHLVTIQMNPFEYIPIKKEVYIQDIQATIFYEECTTNKISPAKQSTKRNERIKLLIKSKVENKDDVESFSNANIKLVENKSLSIEEIDSNSVSTYSLINRVEEQVPDYIIITNNQLESTFQILADWKIKKGVPTIIKSLSEIENEYTGVDIQEKIRLYIRDCYLKWGNGLYVFLGGDTNIIPARMATNGLLRSKFNPKQDEQSDLDSILTSQDLYYSALEGDWNANKNHIYNEVVEVGEEIYVDVDSASLIPNVFLGRASVENVTEAQTFVNKVINYEKASSDIDYSYVNNYLAACGFISKSNSGWLSNLAASSIHSYLSQHSITNKWYQFDHHNCTCSKHEHKQYSIGEELNKSNFISALNTGGNSGLNHFHIVYHMDHSHPNNMGTSSLDKHQSITGTDVDDLYNGDYLQIVISGGCSPAADQYDCIAERFLNNPNGGAVAFIGNADSGISNEHFQFKRFLDAIHSGLYQLGDAFHYIVSQSDSYEDNNRLHLLGDPEMPVWTSAPQDLDVQIGPSSSIKVVSGVVEELSIKVKNLPTGEEATVCIMKDGEFYTTYTINDTDTHTYLCDIKTAGHVDITVTAHNFRPFEKSLPVLVESEQLVSLEDVVFYNGTDRIISPGETVKVSIKVRNNGTTDATGITAQMTSPSPYITMIKNQIVFPLVLADSVAVPNSNSFFSFKVSEDAPEIAHNDWNATYFHVGITDCNGIMNSDTFNVDLLPVKMKMAYHKILGLGNATDYPSARNSYLIQTQYTNTGKITANPTLIVTPINSASIDTVYYAYAQKSCFWRITVNEDFVTGTPLKFNLKLQHNNSILDSMFVDLSEERAVVNESLVEFYSDDKSISLYWDEMKGADSYNIYRGTSTTPLNKLPITTRYYNNIGLNQSYAYDFRVTALNSSLIETDDDNTIKTWTTFPQVGLFPIMASGENHEYIGEATAVDFNYDGNKEIIMMARYHDLGKGKLIIVNPDGSEPYDIDGNITTFSGYADIPWRTEATPTVADIYGTGEPCIIAVTRHLSPETDNHIICYSSMDKNEDYLPDSLWDLQVDSKYYRSATVTDLNAPDGKGEKEIIIRSTEGINGVTGITGIKVLDCNGNMLHFLGKDTLNNHYSTVAVADLDGNGYKEIITSNSNKIYVWNQDGTLKNGKIFFQESNSRLLTSSPIVCDFDNDNEKEIVVASRTNPSYIYVINQDGTCIPYFDGTMNSASIPYHQPTAEIVGVGICHSVSVGDIDNDGLLELVTIGSDCVKAWNNDGSLCFNRKITGLFPLVDYAGNLTTPILADVNGDTSIDIVFHEGNKIYAINNIGEDILGFPLETTVVINNGVCVSDIDNDGLNELIAGDNFGYIYVWKTQGRSSAIEWGRAQFDTENTSEYIHGYKDQWVITSNTSWEGGTYPNDIIVRSGTFTIPLGVTLDMRKPYRIYVMDGATLEVNGGSITNADIVVKNGGTVNISQDSDIVLRSSGGNLQVDKGATMNITLGIVR